MDKIEENKISKHISVNQILLELSKNPMKIDEFKSVERYFNALKDACLLDVIGTAHYYNKETYDFYFIIEDSSRNWAKKLIIKKTMVDLILKYRVIDYIVIEEYKHLHFELINNG